MKRGDKLGLINIDRNMCGEFFNNHVLEQWKTCVEITLAKELRKIITAIEP